MFKNTRGPRIYRGCCKIHRMCRYPERNNQVLHVPEPRAPAKLTGWQGRVDLVCWVSRALGSVPAVAAAGWITVCTYVAHRASNARAAHQQAGKTDRTDSYTRPRERRTSTAEGKTRTLCDVRSSDYCPDCSMGTSRLLQHGSCHV